MAFVRLASLVQRDAAVLGERNDFKVRSSYHFAWNSGLAGALFYAKVDLERSRITLDKFLNYTHLGHT